jgi:hypothetical protein
MNGLGDVRGVGKGEAFQRPVSGDGNILPGYLVRRRAQETPGRLADLGDHLGPEAVGEGRILRHHPPLRLRH